MFVKSKFVHDIYKKICISVTIVYLYNFLEQRSNLLAILQLLSTYGLLLSHPGEYKTFENSLDACLSIPIEDGIPLLALLFLIGDYHFSLSVGFANSELLSKMFWSAPLSFPTFTIPFLFDNVQKTI